ncbi:MAG: hypothetical protein ABT940_09690 [Alphaproteobacteria bacterium]
MSLFKNPFKGDGAQTPANPAARPNPVIVRNQVPRPVVTPPTRPAQMHDPKAPPSGPETVFEAAIQLSTLLEKENAALKNFDTDAVLQMAERKEALVRLYNDQMTAVAANPAVLDGVAEARRKEMKQVAETLRERIDLNVRLLKGNLDAAQRVMKIIVDAAKEERTKNAPYGPRGAVSQDYRDGQPTALSFNRNV